LRDFCTTRGLAISWLIVGIVHPCSRETVIGSANSFGTTRPIGRIARIKHAQSEIAPTARCRAESASTPQRTAIATGQHLLPSLYRGHASEINLERTCSRERRSSWHCLTLIDSV
jgi:hypothetical protein